MKYGHLMLSTRIGEKTYLAVGGVSSEAGLQQLAENLLDLDSEFGTGQLLAFEDSTLELVQGHHQDLGTSNKLLGDLAIGLNNEETVRHIKC